MPELLTKHKEGAHWRERLAGFAESLEKRDRRRFELWMMAVLVVGLTLLISSAYMPTLQGFAEGEAAPRTIVADEPVTVIDLEATEELRESVARTVPPVYTTDPQAQSRGFVKNWNRYNIKKTGANKHHDVMTGDFDNDGAQELVFWNQGANTLFIAELPANPKKAGEWVRTPVYVYDADSEMEPRGGIGAYPGWRGRNEHEGLAKADIDGDGVTDIIGGGRWFKYLGNGKFRENLVDASYTFTRTAVGQFIEGGRPEILLTIGDGLGPLYLYEWIQKGETQSGTWVPKIVIETLYDGHTIDVLDFNGDGHPDIFSAEMKLNPNNPGAIRLLLGDGKGNFVHHVIDGDIGCHEGKIFDFEGDGDYDILSKPYNWDAPRLDLFINGTKK